MTTETSQADTQPTEAQAILQGVGIHVKEGMTTPSKPGKQPRKVFNIVGNTDPYKHIIYDLAMRVKQYRGVLSCWEDPTEELAERIESEGALSFAERKQSESERADARADRLLERASKHKADADSHYRVQHEMGKAIPMGQPILVGHHSEGMHRRHLAKIDSHMRHFVEKSNYAEHLQERAATAQRTADQNHSMKYLGNRVEECQTKLREIERNLQGFVNPRDRGVIEGKPAEGNYKATLLREQAEYQERLEYWQGLIEEKGGIQYSKDNIKVGDWVYYIGWCRVYRVNPKTVRLHYTSHTQSWANPCKYHEIKGYCPREKAVEFGKKFGIDLDTQNQTNLPLGQACKEAEE